MERISMISRMLITAGIIFNLMFVLQILSKNSAFGQTKIQKKDIPKFDIQNNQRTIRDILLTERGYITFHPSSLLMAGVRHFKIRGEKNPFCLYLHRAPRIFSGDGIPSDDSGNSPVISEDEAVVGYSNYAWGPRRRCGAEEGWVLHALVFFDMDPWRLMVDQNPRLRIVSWTLNFNQRRLQGFQQDADCIIGRRAPLEMVHHPSFRIVNLGLQLNRTRTGEPVTRDGSPQVDFIRETGDRGTLNELERDAEGRAELQWSPPSPTSELRLDSGTASFALISIRNRDEGGTDDCVAAYGNFRLVIEYTIGE